MTKRESFDDDQESLLKSDNSGTDDNPKINYRGWKVMPFIIGEEGFVILSHCFFLLDFLLTPRLILLCNWQEMRFLRS